MIRCLLLSVAMLGCSDTTEAPPPPTAGEVELRLLTVAEGLANPVFLTSPPGDPRQFVVEQPGRIRIIQDGQLLSTPFLNIQDKIRSGGEQGLLSVAFHPDYAANGYFYVNYTDLDGDTRVERYQVSEDPNVADPATAKEILRVDQPFANHNGGLVAFGLDGMLYIGMGDGGSGGDPMGHGQNPATLLGALLRIDVDSGDPYAIPPDNPYASTAGARGEIWAIGLRNPWRFAFDSQTDLLYIADVGQRQWEEVNAEAAGDAGLNYGWNIMEGAHCYDAEECDRSGLVLPALEYEHPEGCSITGGYVYRGEEIPEIRGHYFYSDYCEGWLRSVRIEGGEVAEQREWTIGDAGRVLSFGEDSGGELYLLSANGSVYKLARDS